MEEKSIRQIISEGYKVEADKNPKKPQDEQKETVINLKESDVDTFSPTRILSWGYRKLIEDNANSKTD